MGNPCMKSPYAKVHGSVSVNALHRKEAEESACGKVHDPSFENTPWAFTSWLWNFLYNFGTPWGFFMIVRFYYYHLNLIYESLIGLNYFGEIWYCWSKLSFGNDIVTTINFQARDLDLQAMVGVGMVLRKTLDLCLVSDHIWIWSIQGFGNNVVL